MVGNVPFGDRDTPVSAHTGAVTPEDVEQLGRIEMIRRLRQVAEAPSLDEVFAMKPTLHGTIGSYASAWAAVAFLAGHPRYREAFAATEKKPLDRWLHSPDDFSAWLGCFHRSS